MTRSYRIAVGMVRSLVRIFFRRVEVEGREHVPEARGGLLVAWHPNGLIDPALVLLQLPGRVVFGARHGLFGMPIIGRLLRSLGTVPIYRAADHADDEAAVETRRERNRTSLDALARRIAEGSFSALFPEGLSHDAPHLMELRSGGARLYYRARQLQDPDAPAPAIVPVGLHYDHKHAFRSRALVRFHPPLDLPAALDVRPAADASDASIRERARLLTGEIGRALESAVHPTETWEVHQLMHRVRKLVRAERAARAEANPGRPDLLEKQLGFARVWAGYRARLASHPEEVTAALDRIRRYDADLAGLGVEDHELDRDPRLGSAWLPLILAAQVLMVYVLLPPVLVLGWIVNLPPAALCLLVCKALGSSRKDEASLKIIVGAIIFPVAWVVAGVLVSIGAVRLGSSFPRLPAVPLAAGLATAALGAIGGAVALRYGRLSRETMRAIRVRVTRRREVREVDRLRSERGALYDWLMRLADGLELPGAIAPDGRIVSR